MLGTPPAFILSQDQTLRLKSAASLPRSILVFAGSPGPSVGWARLAGISRFDSSRNIRFSRFPPPLPGGLAASLPGERRKEILYLPVAILSRTFFRKLSVKSVREAPGPRPPRKRSPNIIRSPPRPGKGVFRKIFGAGRREGVCAGGGRGKLFSPPLFARARARAGGSSGGGGAGFRGGRGDRKSVV